MTGLYCLAVLETLQVWNQSVGRGGPSGGTDGECAPCLSSSSRQAVANNLCALWLLLHGFLSLFLSLCSDSPLLMRIPLIKLGPTLIQYYLILTSLLLQRLYFQIRSHSQIPEVRTWTFLLGTQFNPQQAFNCIFLFILCFSNSCHIISRYGPVFLLLSM